MQAYGVPDAAFSASFTASSTGAPASITAVTDRYGQQDPAEVAAELRQAAFAIAGRFETVTGDQWQRAGARSDGARFTVETFARYLVHDPVHHLYDVTGQRAVSG